MRHQFSVQVKNEFLKRFPGRDDAFLSVVGIGDNRKIRLTVLHSPVTSSKGGSSVVQSEEKLSVNISRAKRKIYDYSMCNPWSFFFTGTLDAKKYDRTDLKKFHSDFTQFVRNQNTKYGCHIKFLVVPELHSDLQSWHFHGLLYGLPDSALHRFHIGDRMGKYIADKVSRGFPVFSWIDYANKFGFCDLEPIKNTDAISLYITKYINKELAHSVSEVGAHLYYLSRGLNGASEVKKGCLMSDPFSFNFDFENDFCKILTLPYDDVLLQTLKDAIL